MVQLVYVKQPFYDLRHIGYIPVDHVARRCCGQGHARRFIQALSRAISGTCDEADPSIRRPTLAQAERFRFKA